MENDKVVNSYKHYHVQDIVDIEKKYFIHTMKSRHHDARTATTHRNIGNLAIQVPI